MPRISPRSTLVAVLLLLGCLTANVLHTIRGQSLTWDEGDHIFSGYKIWQTHDYSFNPEHPPLVKMLGALPLLALPLKLPQQQGRFFKTEAYLDGRELLYRNGPTYPAATLIFRARLLPFGLTLAAALLVFFAARELFGPPAGLIALTLFCFDPNLLAHAAYVTTDMAASCTIFATIYFLWRYTQRPTLARLATIGLAAGVALAAKHSTILLAPMLALLLAVELIRSAWQQRNTPNATPILKQALRSLGTLTAITLIAVTVLWAFYGFRYNARPAGLVLTPSLVDYVGPLAGIEAHGILLVARLHLLPESYLYGLADVRAMANGMPSYFFGHVYAHGVWFYFPTLFLIKSTLGLLALLALTAFAAARGWLRQYRGLVYFTLPPLLYLAVAMDSHLNIGARHILPIWIFCCVLAAGGAVTLARRSRAWTIVIAAILLLHVASSLRAAPNYIAYSNEAWGGPSHTYRYLTDSNTDWGQQLVATADYLRERHITHCSMAYFVQPFVNFADYGIPCRPLPTADSLSLTGPDIALYDVPPVIGGEADGPILISAGDLNGFEFGSSILNPYEALRSRTPIAFIQDGIFVFNGPVAVPLASALSHVQRSGVLLKAGNAEAALTEAQLAQQLAPGEVQPELALGDALTATHHPTEAAAAYSRARTRILQMDTDAQQPWLKRLKE